MIHRRATTTLALATLALAGCAGAPAVPEPNTSLTVVTSTNVYGAIAQAVGGDRISVESLITEPTADPHSYESTPADAAKVARAQVVVFNGGGYDDFVPQLVQSSGAQLDLVEVVQVAGAERTQMAETDAHQQDDADHRHEHGEYNEHVWYDLRAMQRLADRIAERLAAADPEGAAHYTARADDFSAAVGELLVRIEGIAERHRGARVVATEPLATHLIEAAGLIDATPAEFTQAVEEDIEPPAATVAQTLALFTGDPVQCLIMNTQTETAATEQVRRAAQAAGVPVVNLTETLPEGTIDYVSWMRSQIDALSAALDR